MGCAFFKGRGARGRGAFFARAQLHGRASACDFRYGTPRFEVPE